ncbi:hypothetical protein LZ420_000494 [Listeria monocytogenes]|nr:hypothetical protein [Listeria monocytogenes]EAE7386062.1 hypothetical protein [Listeria monocytogenes]EAW7127334.1 hypothetical protein [Listeria monocytogenes]EAW7192049.1 hypothetical protein [Listeria monocytogenes]ECL0028409.1 hypothetical protein [Listeria monocytogenes]
MNNFIAKYGLFVLIGGLLIIVVPLIVGFLFLIPFFDFLPGSNEGWLGFWGGYLGAVLSIFGALWLFNKQSSKDKQEVKDTLEAQMKITSTFAYFEYLLAENKELINVVQKTLDDIFEYSKIAKDIEKNPVMVEMKRMNPVHGELQRDFNSMVAITSVLYRGYREDIDNLQNTISDKFMEWHDIMRTYYKGCDFDSEVPYIEIQRLLNNLRTEVAKESRLLVNKMKIYMDEEKGQ